MTIESTTNRVDALGDGSSTSFDFPYIFWSGTDLKVYLDGELQSTGYTVSGGDGDDGSVVFSTAPEADVVIVILRQVPLKQESDYNDFNRFPAETVETDFDKSVALSQQLEEKIGRCIIQGVSGAIEELSLPTPVANKILGWNADADGLENKDMTVTETSYDGVISAGLDASKSATPTTNDIYVATDTMKMYVCYASGTWTSLILDEDDFASNSATQAPSQQSVAAYVASQLSSGAVLSTGEITSDVSAIEITIPTGYDEYELEIFDFKVTAGGGSSPARIEITVSSDGGSTYKSAGYYSSAFGLLPTSTAAITTAISNSNTSEIQIEAVANVDADADASSYVKIVMPSLSDADTNPLFIAYAATQTNQADQSLFRHYFSQGVYNSQLAVNKIKLVPYYSTSATEFTNGRYRLKGINYA